MRRRLRPLGGARFGNLRRVSPISTHWGYDRGTPVDRYYIEAFLRRHAKDIRGRVLEIGDDTYTRAFGGERATMRDVLHVHPGHPGATFSGDLAGGAGLPSAAFDCVILTQTLHLVFDLQAAIATLHRILKPGGVLLATVPGISPIHAGEWKATWYWSFTPASLRRLLAEMFQPAALQVHGYGNVLASCAFLQGLTQEELTTAELDATDPRYPLIVAGRACREH